MFQTVNSHLNIIAFILMFQAKEFATSMATEKRLAYIDG